MQGLNTEILEEFEAQGMAVSFAHQGGTLRSVATCRDKFGEIVCEGTGSDKHLALAACHKKWKAPAEPKAKPKAKTTSKKKAVSAEKEEE